MKDLIAKHQQYLNGSISAIENKDLQKICREIVSDPEFLNGYGSTDHHHIFRGGLVCHTAEVTVFAVGIANGLEFLDTSKVNRDVLITAAVCHDYMKIRDYTIGPDGKAIKAPYRNLVRHVAGSHAHFLSVVKGKDVPPETILLIEHAILAHHGRKEWGSPIEPQTLEAKILHDADIYSVAYGPTSKIKES